jgi:hypothetical protein
MSEFELSAFWLLASMQLFVGFCIFAGATRVLLISIDEHSPIKKLALWVAIQTSGAWYGLDPLMVGSPTSTLPGVLFASIVAWVLLRHWRVICAVVEGRCTLACVPHLHEKATMSMWPLKSR